ncbi:antibiotic biosynthesis monooxygenase [Anaerolinea thermolimosa]|uniref:antibiotic biosynthesis monooxygenase n=1 Tax=Anaerolinea thermolimosa TaxID=229919 RepID=UPI0007835A71|nr:antibiotic biosynthesis monooxygenase [Anaerolinea thermolimosa]GAP05994.1 antibiotic biosynthesis monooxygenase [Anaerolinea thermolimosa]
MYVTILQGQVAQENWGELQRQYEIACKATPEGLLQTFLVQDDEQKTHWQIITFWKNEEAYHKAHEEKKTETCVLLFCNAGTVPERRHFHVRRGHQRV